MKKESIFSRLFGYMGKFKITMALSVVMAGIAAVVNLSAFVCVYNVAKEIVLSLGDFSRLNQARLTELGWQAVFLISMSFGLYGMALLFSHITAYNTVARLRIQLIDHTGALPLGYHSVNPSGKQRKIIEKNTDNLETLIAHQIPDFVQSLVLPIAFLAFMFTYDWRLSLICLLPILIGFGILASMLKGASEGLAKQYQKSAEDISNAATEYVRGISVVKVFGQTANSFRRYKAAVKEYSDYVIKYALSMTNEMLNRYFGNAQGPIPLWGYWGAAFVLLVVIFVTYKITYRKKYSASGKEDMRLRMELADKIRRLPLAYLGKRDLSDLTSVIMDDVAVTANTLATVMTELISGLLSGLIAIASLFIYDWRLALSLAACLPLAGLAMSLSKLISEGANKRNKQKKLAISDGLQEYLENIKVLRTSQKMSDYQKDLAHKIKRIIPGLVLHELLAGLSISVSYNVMRIGLGLVIITGSALLISGEITLLTFLLFLFVAARIYEPLTKACEMLGELVYSLVSAKRIRDLLDYPEQQGREDIPLSGYDITFDRVSFGYNQEDVIRDVSFTAKQGEITALVGPSGCGKSTLCKLSARFWDVQRGSVLIGGINVNDISPEALLKNYSMVFQDVVLFNDTIFNNIRIGKEDATKQEVLAAAKLARCDDFIARLPQGYDTVIGENGKTLSGGERQRLSIARAFLKDAPIILLDESTASIDPENETKIQEAIGTLIQNKTVLIIAHKLRSIVDCDKIIVLKEGHLAEEGTHNQLMEQKSLYHRLYTLQNESMTWAVKTV